ncbi:serine/threonine protein kinase [Bacillus cereus]|uniref:serine/threonine protein kinase n=1 Tax=Bacillus cereus TaxID=1396 RepID=UPI000BF66998|nr:serine/threonine protein kinase [Bacillus cereus]PFR26494.1 serine/threonine protein kinase [Bacillus cereus]
MNEYERNYQEEKKKQLTLWKEMIVKIFGDELDNSMKITNRSRIIEILNTIGESEVLNHTFMPSGGGLDLSGAAFSNEEGRVELKFGESAKLVNPESLTFHPVGDNPEWWYFRLNTTPFEPSGVYEESQQEEEDAREEIFKTVSQKQVEWAMSYHGEEVLEIEAGKYVERYFWDINHLGYDEDGNLIPIPDNARVITRKINGGAFVVFPKLSLYNRNTSTYDGRHNKMTDEAFNSYINRIVDELTKSN